MKCSIKRPLKLVLALTVLSLTSLVNIVEAKMESCKITINIKDQERGKIQIRLLTMGNADTISFTKNELIKTYELTEPTPVYISDMDGQYQIFFAEPKSKLKVDIELKEGLKVTFLEGSKSNDLFRSLIARQEPIQQFSKNLAQQFNDPKANRDSINEVLTQKNKTLKDNFFQFIKDNGKSEVVAFVVYSSVMNERSISHHTADTMFQYVQEPARSGFYGKELTKTINKLKSVEVGFIAPDFTLPDSSGKKMVTLRKVKADYILLDLWASWCGPCKAEIPHMKKAYEKYHDKGFEIVGVSIDQKIDAWKAALKQFNMPWIHLYETDHIVGDLYHFPTIPKTLLLDKTGKIIATDLRGDALEMKLKLLIDGK